MTRVGPAGECRVSIQGPFRTGSFQLAQAFVPPRDGEEALRRRRCRRYVGDLAMGHKIDVAPTGRASCRGCKKAIDKGTVRFGEESTNPYSEEGGTSYRYWHLACAATKIANELAPVLAAYTEPVEDRAGIEALVAQHMRPELPFAEHAPNGRARCRACDQSIAKGELRVAFERTFEG